MREPYNTVITGKTAEFTQLGFILTENSTYSITFSKADRTIDFNTERYYHPSITTVFRGLDGVEKSFRLVREILAPEKATRDIEILNRLSQDFDFKHTPIRELEANGSFSRYVSTSVDQVIDFIKEFGDGSFDGSFLLSEYQKRASESLKRFGVS